MQRFVLGGLTVLLSTVALMPAVKADIMSTDLSTHTSSQVTPAQLISLAERGYLQEQGIPSGNQLSSAFNFGELTARELIQAAVDARRASSSTLEDAGYIAAVDMQLDRLSGHSGDDSGS